MRRYGGTRGGNSRLGFVRLAAVVALAAAATMVMACGSTPSTAGGGGGGGGNGDPQLTLSPNQAKAGQVVTVRGTSMPKGETEPIVRGELVAETPEGEISLVTTINIFNQTFSQTAYVPDQLTPGEYTITLKLKGEQAGKEVSAKLTVLP